MANKGFWVRITSGFFLLTATLLLAIVGYSIANSLIRGAEIKREVAVLQGEIGNLKEKNEQLTNLISYLGTEESKERETRLQLGLQKSGENVVVIPMSDDASKPPVGQEAASGNNLSNVQLWIKYFFGN